jgi:serine protease Do
VEGIGYAIPINDAMEVVDALIKGESLEKTQTAYLGISGNDVDSSVASAYGLPLGVYVKEVYEGTGAAEAGVCQGDIITALNGTSVTTMEELQNLLMDYSAGDSVKLTLSRMNNGYQSMEVTVVLSERSALENAQSDSSDDSESNSEDYDDNDYYNGDYYNLNPFNWGFGY